MGSRDRCSVPSAPLRISRSYLSTPLSVYLLVMAPICALEAFLVATRCPLWMQGSAGVVVAMSFYGLARGYFRRLVLTPDSGALAGLFRRYEIRWSEVRQAGIYVPGGGVGATEYLYLSKRTTVPRGKWDIDAETVQVQNREGLRDMVEGFARAAGNSLSIRSEGGAP